MLDGCSDANKVRETSQEQAGFEMTMEKDVLYLDEAEGKESNGLSCGMPDVRH